MRSSRLRRRSVAGALAAGAALALVAATQQPAPRRANVVARDYAFEGPDVLPAGEVAFELENRGAHDPQLQACAHAADPWAMGGAGTLNL